MTLVRFKPNTKDFFRDTVVPSNMMNLIDSMFNDSNVNFERTTSFSPRVDVLEKADQYEIHMALPGMSKEEISIEVEKDTLRISGEKKVRKAAEGEKYHRVENYSGKFARIFNLPEHSNKELIGAAFENGMLNITVPKVEVKETKSTVVIK